MRTKFTWADAVAIAVWLLPLVYLSWVYSSLGTTLPVHFDLQGRPNGYGSRAEFVGAILLISGVSLGVSLLVRFLPNIDPKKNVKYSQPVFIRISYALLFFLSAVGISVVYAGVHGHFAFKDRLMFPLLGLFFAYLGNLFNNLKPNYFVGIRTPWTLENEVVWRKTHQLGGRLWLVGGIAMSILCWVLPPAAAQITFTGCMLVLVLVPVTYSYICFRQLQKRPS